MIILYILIAVFIAWIWVDYYRLIDIYEAEKLKYFILTFLLGCLSVELVMVSDAIVPTQFSFEMTGNFVNDFLYCVFNIGLVEEIAKTVPFLVVLALCRKQFNEPIDYLAFICVAALGFSAAENVLYFQNYGPTVINTRAILSTVSHMFDASLIAYGIIRHIYRPDKRGVGGVLFFFSLAVLSHAFYDFWLLYEGAQPGGWIVTILFFMVSISVFAGILNNALNNSTFFSYKKVVNSSKVAGRLLGYYGIVFLVQFVILLYLENFMYAVSDLTGAVIFSGSIVIVCCVRMSRFKLIKDRWDLLKPELPFTFAADNLDYMPGPRAKIRIKGEGFNETYVNAFYEEYFHLTPVSKRNTHIGGPKLAFIERKIFLKNDETFYVAKMFHEDEEGAHELILLKPKTGMTTTFGEGYPIVAILKVADPADLDNVTLTGKHFKFTEWAFLKPKDTPKPHHVQTE